MKRGMTRWYWAEAASPRWSSMRKSCLNHTIATSSSFLRSTIAASWGVVAVFRCSSPKNAFEEDDDDADEESKEEEEEEEKAPFPHSRCTHRGAFMFVPVVVVFIISCCHGLDVPLELPCINSHANAVPSPDLAKVPLTPTKLFSKKEEMDLFRIDKLTLGGTESSGEKQEACTGGGLHGEHMRSEVILDTCKTKKVPTTQYI